MRGWITHLIVLSVVFGAGGSAFAAFRDFVMTGAGTDDQWTTVANWEEGALPTTADHARIEKDCVITNSAEAGKVSVAGFGADASLTVNGSLTVGSAGIDVAYSRKNALLDVSGSLSSTGQLKMGTDVTKTPTATVNFNSGSMVSLGGINMGLTTNGGTYAVNQSGGAISLSGELYIADVNDSLASGTYTISDGSLSAYRLNTGGNGASTAKFSVVGSDAVILFSSVSWLAGQTELEFILDADGISVLMMTNGGYSAASTVSLTVDASAYTGSTGDGILLIGTTNTPSAFTAANVSVPLGYYLDYRSDGLYLMGASSPAAVSPLFHDNMVLQRDMDTPVWGCDAPGSTVTVKLDGVVVGTAVADGNGDWITGIGSHAHDGGQAHVFTVEFGAGSVQFNEVVFGDVYLASGQSNMNMPMTWLGALVGTGSYAEELAVADSFPLIRHVDISSVASASILADPPIEINWTKCSQTSLGEFSAVGYFFAKNLYQETGVPIGLLFSAWGGKSIEQFTSPSGMEAVPELAGMLEYQEEGGVPLLYEIYNAMIAPLMPYGIKGAIWYQGENNGAEGNIYKYKMQALARGWRKEWGQGDFPFYYVQLASFNTGDDWPGLRNAQTAALSETNFGMAVTIDVGDYSDIHPRNKYDVGGRLARWALAKDYGTNIVYSSPLYRSAVIEDSQMRVLFDYADSGLFVGQKTGTDAPVATSDPLQNFEIAGADKIFVAADAVIDQDSVLVSAASVSSPMHVRYCWASFPAGSNLLYNAAGLPASPFSSVESYNLSVESGSGTATGLASGSAQSISANAPASGKVFDRWIGAASEITNPNASSTTVTMPEHSLYLLASYRDTSESVYSLTVNNGYGGGTSQAGSILNIEAGDVAGQDFSHWAGDTQTVVNVNGSSTTLRMPTHNIQVTAVYHIVATPGPTNLWDDSFAGTTLDDSWLSLGSLSTITQSDGLFMTVDGTSGFAKWYLATENSQAQSSGDPAAMFDGNPAYNFYHHNLEITIDGLSMPEDVTDGNLLFIAGVSGNPVAQNAGPRNGQPGAFLRVDSSPSGIYLGVLESTGTSRPLMGEKKLNALPDSIVFNLNAKGWDVEITGTTFSDGTTRNSGIWNHISSTIFESNAVLVVGTYNENTATTTSGDREISISGIQVVAGGAGATKPDIVALPRIGVRETVPFAQFYDTSSGEEFHPVGTSYVKLAPMHATFADGVYDPDAAELALQQMSDGGFTVVRAWVYHGHYVLRALDPPLLSVGGAYSTDTAVLHQPYIDNLVDFLTRANRHGVYVQLAIDREPENQFYRDQVNDGWDDIEGVANREYMVPGSIEAKEIYVKELIRNIADRDPRLLSTIFAYEIRNEVHANSDYAPFNQTTGVVATATGNYDMSAAASRQACFDDNITNWLARVGAAIKEKDPDALTTTSVFSHQAVGKEDYVNQGLLPIDTPDTRWPVRPSLLVESDLDFVDYHSYIPAVWNDHLQSSGWSELDHSKKPFIAGEYGILRDDDTLLAAVDRLHAYREDILDSGFCGAYLFTWDTDPFQRLSAMEQGGFVYERLKPIAFTQWDFSRDGFNDFWSIGNGIGEMVTSNGQMHLTINGSDPTIYSPTCRIDAPAISHLKITLKNSSPGSQAQLFWTTKDSNTWSEARSVQFAISSNDAELKTYVVDLTINPAWTGMVDQLRYDLVQNSVTNGTVDIERVEFYNPVSTAEKYEIWATLFGLDTNSTGAMAFDYEPDGLDNLTEYALGGNPTNADAASVLPVFQPLENHFYYIHNERTDDTSLSYTVEVTTNLVSNVWKTNGVEFVGETAFSNVWKTVTNQIPTLEKEQQFIRLEIEKD